MAARERLLAEMAPRARVHEYAWSGGRTNALVVGEGPPLLLVHGGLGTNVQWAPILEQLAARHRVIAPDRPACGLSTPFPYGRTDIEAHAAAFLRETLDAFDVRAAPIVGNSMGGRWAIALATRHPERVERLVLVGAPAGCEDHAIPGPVRGLRIPLLRRLVVRFASRGGAKGTRDFYGSCLSVRPERQPDLYWEALGADTARNARGWPALVRNAVGLDGRIVPALRLEGRLAQVKAPTHFVWGSKDAFADAARGRAVAREIGTATFEEVPDAGHLPWIDEPDAVAAAVLRVTAPGVPLTRPSS